MPPHFGLYRKSDKHYIRLIGYKNIGSEIFTSPGQLSCQGAFEFYMKADVWS